MSARTARWIVWSAVGLYFIMVTAGIVLQVQTGETLMDFSTPFIVATKEAI